MSCYAAGGLQSALASAAMMGAFSLVLDSFGKPAAQAQQLQVASLSLHASRRSETQPTAQQIVARIECRTPLHERLPGQITVWDFEWRSWRYCSGGAAAACAAQGKIRQAASSGLPQRSHRRAPVPGVADPWHALRMQAAAAFPAQLLTCDMSFKM